MDPFSNVLESATNRMEQFRADSAEFKDFQKKLADYEADKIAFARGQGQEHAEHFLKFVSGEESRFKRYYHVTESEGRALNIHEMHHKNMHDGFWDAVQLEFPDMALHSRYEKLQDEPTLGVEADKRYDLELYVSEESRVALMKQIFYSDDGKVCGLEYEAALLPDMALTELGNLAISQAMQ